MTTINPVYLEQQKNEITEYVIYQKLAKLTKDPKNAVTLRDIASDEKKHYEFWKKVTGREVEPDLKKVNKYIMLSKMFGLSYSLNLLEKGEQDAELFYESVSKEIPEVLKIKEDEEEHEQVLLGVLNDERLNYAGAVVLGLNDALVEFTGTLAGLTFAFANNKLIGITGLVMGVAASLSMAASGYLASQEDEREDLDPVKSAIFTGIAYIVTVAFLVFPYLIQSDPYYALGGMIVITIGIIAIYTHYISVAKNVNFWKRFVNMVAVSLSVAVISFGIGTFIKSFFNIDV